jgi:hypothetical protein
MPVNSWWCCSIPSTNRIPSSWGSTTVIERRWKMRFSFRGMVNVLVMSSIFSLLWSSDTIRPSSVILFVPVVLQTEILIICPSPYVTTTILPPSQKQVTSTTTNFHHTYLTILQLQSKQQQTDLQLIVNPKLYGKYIEYCIGTHIAPLYLYIDIYLESIPHVCYPITSQWRICCNS